VTFSQKGESMKFLEQPKSIWAVCLMILAISGCSTLPSPLPVETWRLSAKENPESAMLFGRIGSPDGSPLTLNFVNYNFWGKVYFNSGTVPRFEDSFTMSNNYFVVPNIKPGKYLFDGFYANGVYNKMPYNIFGKKDFIEVNPGEVKFVGSYDYVDGSLSSLRRAVGIPGSSSLKQIQKPSELEMLQWLSRADNNSGWKPAIKKRILELGGKS
jgi:hypothetical protein